MNFHWAQKVQYKEATEGPFVQKLFELLEMWSDNSSFW